MAYVAPAIKDRFETLSMGLQKMILERNERINTMQDLIHVLEAIVKEDEK